MGYILEIDACVHVRRTEEQKKALEEEIRKLENETSGKGDILSYDVRTKKKVYKINSDLEYLKRESKDFFTHSEDMCFESDADVSIIINAVKEFYGLDFPCYKYEGVSLEDLKSIIALLKPTYDDGKNVEYVRNELNEFIDGIIKDLEYNKIDNSRIISFTFDFSLN